MSNERDGDGLGGKREKDEGRREEIRLGDCAASERGTRDSGWETQNRGVWDGFWQGKGNEETTERREIVQGGWALALRDDGSRYRQAGAWPGTVAGTQPGPLAGSCCGGRPAEYGAPYRRACTCTRCAALTGDAMPRELSAEFQGKAGTCLFRPFFFSLAQLEYYRWMMLRLGNGAHASGPAGLSAKENAENNAAGASTRREYSALSDARWQ